VLLNKETDGILLYKTLEKLFYTILTDLNQSEAAK